MMVLSLFFWIMVDFFMKRFGSGLVFFGRLELEGERVLMFFGFVGVEDCGGWDKCLGVLCMGGVECCIVVWVYFGFWVGWV